jgi:hypothetical protein
VRHTPPSCSLLVGPTWSHACLRSRSAAWAGYRLLRGARLLWRVIPSGAYPSACSYGRGLTVRGATARLGGSRLRRHPGVVESPEDACVSTCRYSVARRRRSGARGGRRGQAHVHPDLRAGSSVSEDERNNRKATSVKQTIHENDVVGLTRPWPRSKRPATQLSRLRSRRPAAARRGGNGGELNVDNQARLGLL